MQAPVSTLSGMPGSSSPMLFSPLSGPLREQGLVQVSLGERLPERDVWLLVRRDLKNVPRVRAVTDYLVEVFQRERRLLAG
jgi:DNA-binding transcriptional LysR family regulator